MSVLLVQSVGPPMVEIVVCQCYWSSQLVHPWRRLFCASVTGPVSWSTHGGDCSVSVLLVQSVGPPMEEIVLCQCYWSTQLVHPWWRLLCASVTGPLSWSTHGGDCSVSVLLVQSVGPPMVEIVLCQCYWSSQLVHPWWRLFCVSVTGPVSWSTHGGDCSVSVLLVQSVGPSMVEIVLCQCYWSSQLVHPWWRLFCASVTGPVSWSVHGGDCSVSVLLVQSVGPPMVEIVLCQCYWSSQLVRPWWRLFCVSVTGPVSWSTHGGDCSVPVLLVQSVGPSMVEIVLCQCYWSSQLVRPWWRLFCASVTGPVSWSVHGGDCSVPVLLVQSVGPSMVEIVLCQCYWSSQLVRPWWRLFCASVTGPVSWSVHGGDCSVPVLLVQSVGPSMVEIVLCQCYWSSQLVRPWWRLFCASVTGPVSWSVHGGDCSVPVLLVQSVGPSMVEIVLCQCYWSSQLVRPWWRLFCASVTGPVSWSVHGGDCSVPVLLVQSVGPSMVEIVLCQCYWSSQLVRPWWRLFCASVTGPVSWSVHGGDCSVSVLLVQSVGPSMVEIVLCQCYWSSQLVHPWWRLFCVSVTGPVSWSVHGGDCSVPVLLVQSVGPSMEEIVLCQCYWSSQLVRPWWRLFCASVTGPVSWSVHGGDCSVPVLLVQSVGPSMVEIVLCQCYWSSQLVRPWWRLFCVSVTGPVSWSTHGGDCSVPVLLVQSVGPPMEEIVLCQCYWSSQLVHPWWRLFCASVTGPVSWSVHGGDCSVSVLLVHSVGPPMVEIVLCQCYWSSQLVHPWWRLFCASVTGPVSWSTHGGDCSVPVLLVQSVGPPMEEIVLCQCYWSSQLVHPWWRLFCVSVTGRVSWSVHGGDCSVSVLLVQSVGPSMEEIVLCQCYWSSQLVHPWRRLFCVSVTGPVSWSTHGGDCSVSVLLVQSVGPSMEEIVLCQCYWSSQLVHPWRRLFCVSVTGPVSWSTHGGDCSVSVLLVQSVGPSMVEIVLCQCYWSSQLVHPWWRLFCVSVTGPVSC